MRVCVRAQVNRSVSIPYFTNLVSWGFKIRYHYSVPESPLIPFRSFTFDSFVLLPFLHWKSPWRQWLKDFLTTTLTGAMQVPKHEKAWAFNHRQIQFWRAVCVLVKQGKEGKTKRHPVCMCVNLCTCVGMRGSKFSNCIKQLDRFRSHTNQKREVIWSVSLDIFNFI